MYTGVKVIEQNWCVNSSILYFHIVIIMGKNKQSQRTKNNARPSNSSRSAVLLGTSIPNFVGFTAVKDGGYVPVLPGLSLCNTNEIEMNNVDSNFQIVLKKMNKKDATTKCKALQEFAAMCRDSDLSAVEGMLPFWPRLYCALAIDVEHRVREAAQLAHAAVVKRVGKGIAIYLKQLAGAWFTSQHDTYPPAASAASYSFNDTFPPKKIIDAIVHCQSEILTYIYDNVTVHTAQSLSVQKNLTPEEMDAKYERVLIASLHSYSVYLKKVPVQEIEKTIDIHRRIISSNKFWKLVKYNALPVKTAFFNVLTSIIGNANMLLQDEKKRIVTAIMNNIDETEPALLSAVWESVLNAINKIEDWYTVVNVEKLVLPKLWRVLRSGGHCCACIIYPSLLPLVSQFPKLAVDPHYLYINFFNNMRQGFSAKSVQMSRSETFAITTSFIECLRYSILLNVNNQDLSSALLKEQLIPVLEMCLKADGYIKQILFCEITHLIRYWSKNRHNEDYKSYSYLIKEFWQNLDALFNSLIHDSQNSETFNTPDTNYSQIQFLNTLKIAPVHSRRNLKVKFANLEDDAPTQIQTQNSEDDADSDFLVEFNSFVNSLYVKYFNQITEQHVKKYVTYLNMLITCLESEELSKSLSEFLQKQINFINLYNDILRKWLLGQSNETEEIIELVFNLMKYMNDAEKDEVLNSLTRFEDVLTTRSVMQCALSKNHKNDLTVKKWCSQSKITSLLIDVAKEIASGNNTELEQNCNLILLAFEPPDDGNMLIRADGINEIISILCNSFHEIDESRLLDFAKLISHIVPLTWARKETIIGAVQILETLFELRSQNYFSDNTAFADTVRDVWKQGFIEAFQKLSKEEFVDLTKKFAASMWKKIYNASEEQSKEILVDIAVDFLEIILRNEMCINEDYVKEIILTFLADANQTTWTAETTGIVLYGEVITGKLYVSSLDQKIQIHQECMSIDLISNTISDNLEYCLKWALFNISLLNNLCLRTANKWETEEPSTEELLIHNLNLPGITNLLINIIYSIILGRIYSSHYKSTKCYNNVNKILTTVQNNFKQLQSHINEETFNEIFNHMKVNYSKYGSMLSYLIHFCCTELCPNGEPKELFEIYRESNILSTNDEIALQRLQILYKFQNWENILDSTDDCIYSSIAARSMVINQEESSKYSDILEKLISYEKESPLLLALDCNISQMSWQELNLPLELIRLCTELVTKIPSKLTYEHWNFILISLALWEVSMIKSKQNTNDFKVSALIVAVCQLYHAVQSLINRHQQGQVSEMPPTLLNEWENVFAVDIQSGIIQCWMFYADSYKEETTALKPIVLLDHLGKAVKILNGNTLFKSLTSLNNLRTSSLTLLLKSLQSPIASIQLGAYHVLKHALPELVEEDNVVIAGVENPDLNKLNIKKMEDILQNTQNIVNTILMDFKLCDTVSCTIQPYTDSYTYTVGYLLSWSIILDMCAKAQGDLFYQYVEILKDNFFPSLLNNIFRLMPVEVLQDNKNKGAKLVEIFTIEPSLDFGESWTEWRLDHIVCWLYTNSLRNLPVLVRQWWSTADSRVSATVDKITTHYVSPMLCQEQLLSNKLQSIENMQVKVHPTFREVIALYQMDDTKLKLNITLPPNHPLGPVTVEPGQHAGGTANLRNCHMQLSIFLTHQNGSVWDGLLLWKRNLDKKFAGVEECYICFSIFHITNTYQIPELSCHTCRKKFHTACLYKWFNTSQKSTCPTCRNIF